MGTEWSFQRKLRRMLVATAIVGPVALARSKEEAAAKSLRLEFVTLERDQPDCGRGTSHDRCHRFVTEITGRTVRSYVHGDMQRQRGVSGDN